METNKGNILLPISVVIAGLIIAGAVIFVNKGGAPNPNLDSNQAEQQRGEEPTADLVNEVTTEDHIIGSMDAEIVLVEYSDFECPFCTRAHNTLKQVVEKYEGQVAWVYRHFPLNSIHPAANNLALASECVAEQGGNDAFWSFTDAVFEKGIKSIDQIVSEAEFLGLNGDAIRSCVTNADFQSEVNEDANNAVATGGRGTPHTIAIAKNGTKVVISGAQPVEAFSQVIDQILAQ